MTISPILFIPGCKSILVELMRCEVCINISRPLYHYRDEAGTHRLVCGDHRPNPN